MSLLSSLIFTTSPNSTFIPSLNSHIIVYIHVLTILITFILGLPRWFCGKESTCKFGRQRFSPWVRKIPWRWKWQPTPGFLPGKSHGQKRLVGYSPWGHKVLDTTERLSTHSHTFILIYYVCINFHLQGYGFLNNSGLVSSPLCPQGLAFILYVLDYTR